MPFTQEQLVEAYLQMEKERKEDADYASKAANKLEQLLQQSISVLKELVGYDRGTQGYLVSPYLTTYELIIMLNGYSDWQAMIAQLQAVSVQMQPWDCLVDNPPTGVFDLSGDPGFANRHQQKFTVKIRYHESSY